MTPSNIMLHLATALFTSVVLGMAYIQTPWTPRKVERKVKAWLSPATLVGYLCVVISSFLAAIGQ